MTSDEPFSEYLARARAGDRNALEDMIAPELPRLTALIRLRTGPALRSQESISDLLQSVCREVLESFSAQDFRDRPSFRRWIAGVASHLIVNKSRYYSADKRRADQTPTPFDTHVDDPALLRGYGPFASPSQDATAREEIARIEAAFDALPTEQREVLFMARFEGLSHRQIGLRLGRKESNIAQMVARAKASLARQLARD